MLLACLLASIRSDVLNVCWLGTWRDKCLHLFFFFTVGDRLGGGGGSMLEESMLEASGGSGGGMLEEGTIFILLEVI